MRRGTGERTVIFSKREFENALPVRRWRYLGFRDGQECYLVHFGNPYCFVFIGSSVGADGFSRDTGEDSIRGWLVGSLSPKENPLHMTDEIIIGAKNQAWVQRTDNWDKRIIAMIGSLAKVGNHVKPCPICKNLLRIAKGKSSHTKGFFSLFCPTKVNDKFSNHIPFTLIDKDGEIQTQTQVKTQTQVETQTQEEQPTCPTCNLPLKKVTIRNGKDAGKEALSCTKRNNDGSFANHYFKVL